MKRLLLVCICFIALTSVGQNTYQIAILKYNGGGDWYANPTALPNLIAFANKNIGTNIKKDPATVEVGSSDVFNYPDNGTRRFPPKSNSSNRSST